MVQDENLRHNSKGISNFYYKIGDYVFYKIPFFVSSFSENFVETLLRIRPCPKIISKRDDSDKEGVFQNTFISERGAI